MVINYRILGERIQRLYSRFVDKDVNKIDYREIKVLMADAINVLIKSDHINRAEVSGTTIATYEVESDTTSVELPVYPISLPKEQGVHRVFPKGCPWKPYIPIRSGDFEIVQGTPTEFIEGQTGYYMDGKKLIFTKKVPKDLTLKLIVNDPSIIEDTEALPIPPDMVLQVIQMVFQSLGMGQVSQAELNAKHEQLISNESNRK